MSSIKAGIFDLDNLLISTHSSNALAYKQACLALNVVFDEKKFNAVTGLDWRTSIPLFTGETDFALVEKIHSKKTKLYSQCLSHAKPITPMVDLLHALRGRLRLCVATSASRECAELVLKKFNLLGEFEFVLTSGDVNAGKPKPDLFLLAANKFKLKPEECLVIEDSENGVLAASAAGMPCLKLSLPKEV